MAKVDAQTLKDLVEQAIPDSHVTVRTYSGDDHFEMEVTSPVFAGKSRIAQHQMVYAALGDQMREAVHALALKTRA
ncbi:MAG: BolA family transcriptional regulator [Zetaproteobacteria bacterium CG_4_9_14_3_um_filter_49_83]|nr:MAG: BolA family transcriptional regulator [Zetaproteobacteria bacterium CG1_02_49_23]PIQ29956.1 MAG: BolA family transcriptional regulator [Zetaproteobacteria bacterium CG17_big_fil_post_rev_8_21_14_2_50_50_13]PIV31453.1 MAG: BolA family transcriptional regulator [Zetaproteobacteria bacterium CG02_land_8_20_14_3_00_50_9]PIY55025.1 MAG: BolA family transcriptional regulator [Zetaproteobacteria bacterium CG_4_10_14_0_8_um_filter_49_80]PJA36523.1 MAG: BolA family transcriptional regulator [Zet